MTLTWKKLSTHTLIAALVIIAAFLIGTMSAYAAMDEEECNDTWQDANKIKMGTTVYGDTCDAEREDWFVFTPPVNGTAKLTLTNDKYSEGVLDGDVFNDPTKIFPIDGIEELGAGKADSITFGVKYGKKYYVKIRTSYDGYDDINDDYHFVVNYSIKKTSITSTYRKDNGFRVKWNKKSKASFYQVRYVKKSSFEDYGWKKAKTVKVGKKYGAKTVKKLANKKTYYVQVRVARTIAGKTYYSPWSNKKKIKTK